MGSINEHKSQVAKFMEEIREDIKRIFRKLPDTPISGQSPLRLTELGETISSELHAKEWAEGVAPKLVDKVQRKGAYDIQEFCFSYAERQEFKDDEDLSRMIKQCAFEHALSERQVREVLGLELRDVILRHQATQLE